MSEYQEYTVRVYKDRYNEWYQNDKLHREGGPAIECANGNKFWYQNGKRHREDGPAVEWVTGSKEWWQNGKLHRLNGPAIEWANGNNEWYIEGVKYTEEEFNRKINSVRELTVAQIQDMLGFPIKVVKG